MKIKDINSNFRVQNLLHFVSIPFHLSEHNSSVIIYKTKGLDLNVCWSVKSAGDADTYTFQHLIQ